MIFDRDEFNRINEAALRITNKTLTEAREATQLDPEEPPKVSGNRDPVTADSHSYAADQAMVAHRSGKEGAEQDAAGLSRHAANAHEDAHMSFHKGRNFADAARAISRAAGHHADVAKTTGDPKDAMRAIKAHRYAAHYNREIGRHTGDQEHIDRAADHDVAIDGIFNMHLDDDPDVGPKSQA